MGTVLEALAAALVQWLGGWLGKRQAAKAALARRANRDAAVRDSQAQRDTTDQAVEASHVETEKSADQLRADVAAGGADQLRHEASDVQRAIDAANGHMR